MKKKSVKSKAAIFLYTAAIFIFAVGTVSLVFGIMSYLKMVAQYVAQGYPEAMVTAELIPTTLLPGIFQSIGLYWGIAFVLLGLAMVSKKLAACFPVFPIEAAEIIEEAPAEEPAEPAVAEEATEAEAAEKIEAAEEAKSEDNK